jgi:hypothetical protein
LGENDALHERATGKNERGENESPARCVSCADVGLAVDRPEVGENVLSAAEKG